LPKYTKNTAQLQPPEALKVREALLKARDPHTLLLKEIPAIFGIGAQDDDAGSNLARRLEASLVGLQRAYPNLLDSIELQIKTVLGLPGTTSDEIQSALSDRATRLEGFASDPQLMAFISRAARKRADNDWREMLGLVVVQSRAPKDWSDADRAAFQANLRLLASDFKRLEELALEQRRTGASQVLRIGVLGASEQETREVVSIHDADEPEVERLADSVRQVLSGYDELNDLKNQRRVKVAALSRLILQHLADEEES